MTRRLPGIFTIPRGGRADRQCVVGSWIHEYGQDESGEESSIYANSVTGVRSDPELDAHVRLDRAGQTLGVDET